ncbi:MAG: sn-glycerol-3-phosphate ABC transporter ATP-binding protein UgpC [Chthoniobacterales bacterium]
MAEIIIENLRKVYPGAQGRQGKVAVEGASFTIHDREFMVLVGPSGCGKTTTLRMIAGLEEPTSGTIRLDGRVINEVAPKDRDLAMVFQNYALYPHMSVYRNMAYGLELRRIPREEIRRRVENAANLLGLLAPDNLLERKPKALSGGQRQRVALGRAIVREPKAFLFDEPLSNLDAKMRVETRAELGRLHHQLQATMVYVTHDQVEAMTLADRIVVMNVGRIQQIAPPLEVYHRPANLFVAGFIGSPRMNTVRGKLAGQGDEVVFTEETARGGEPMELHFLGEKARGLAKLVGRDVILGLRPENIGDAVGGGDAGATFAARVDVVEPVGPETWIYLSTDSHQLISRISGTAKPTAVGETMRCQADLERACFFDPGSGEALA